MIGNSIKGIITFLMLTILIGLNVQSCSNEKDDFLESIYEEETVAEDQTNNSGQDDNPPTDSSNGNNPVDDTGSNSDNDTDSGNDGPANPGVIDSTIVVATWKNFAKSAISHTWDDAYKQQVDIAIPLFNEFNMNTTLFVLPNKIDDWSKYKTAYENGHEIASHTISHPYLDEMSASEVEYQLKESKRIIGEKMSFNDCLTLAYPYCRTDNFNLTEKFYIAARSCQGRIEKSNPDDFMKISSFLCGQGSSYSTVDQLNSIAASAKAQNGWGVYMFHLIDGTGGYTIDSAVLREHLGYLKNNSNDYWVDSFLNVVKYIKQRNVAEIRVVEENDSKIVLNYSDNLDNNIYDFPLTFKRMIAGSSSNVQVHQDSTVCESYIVEETIDGTLKRFVVFNAIPDRGDIVIQF